MDGVPVLCAVFDLLGLYLESGTLCVCTVRGTWQNGTKERGNDIVCGQNALNILAFTAALSKIILR